MQTYTGGCHCGRVRFAVTADLERVSACNCSICTRKAYLHLIVPRDRFRMLAGEDDLATYQFGTRTARHHFCRQCGVASFYVPRSHPRSHRRERPLPRRRRRRRARSAAVRWPELGGEHRRAGGVGGGAA